MIIEGDLKKTENHCDVKWLVRNLDYDDIIMARYLQKYRAIIVFEEAV